jgi:hypothetical protein
MLWPVQPQNLAPSSAAGSAETTWSRCQIHNQHHNTLYQKRIEGVWGNVRAGASGRVPQMDDVVGLGDPSRSPSISNSEANLLLKVEAAEAFEQHLGPHGKEQAYGIATGVPSNLAPNLGGQERAAPGSNALATVRRHSAVATSVGFI